MKTLSDGFYLKQPQYIALKLAIRDGAFGACSLRGLPAAGSLRSPLPLALAPHPHTSRSTIKISKIALFRFLASGGLGGHHRHRLNLTPPDEKMSCAAFQKTASYVLNSPRYDEQVSNAAFSKTASNGLNSPRHDEKVSNAPFSKNSLE